MIEVKVTLIKATDHRTEATQLLVGELQYRIK